MKFTQTHPDCGTLIGWYNYPLNGINFTPKECYPKKLEKCPLILASLIEKDVEAYQDYLDRDGWEYVCWYPSCHGPMEGHNSYNIRLYANQQKKATLGISTGYGINLSCSVYIEEKFTPAIYPYGERGLLGYYHSIIGLRRVPLKEKVDDKKVLPWRKFATTELATYWYWGLDPKEKDVYALEPGLKGKKVVSQ